MKQKWMQRFKKIGRAAVIALLLVGSLQCSMVLPDAQAVTQAEIDALKNSAGDLKSEKNELQKKLEALENDKSKAFQQIALLDQQREVLEDEIAVQDNLIKSYEKQITQTQAELEDAQRRQEEQYELFCKRVRAMEEQGTVSYWAVLFNATDFADLLGRLDAASEIMAYDQRLIEELEALEKQIAEQKATLETALSEEKDVRAQQEQSKKNLDAKIAEAQKLSQEIESGIGEYEDALAEVAAEEKRVQADIARKEAELAASLPQPSAGGYIWPVRNSKKITCKFGPRTHPVTGKPSNHTGVDIGGVGYGSDIVATKDGVVLSATYSSAYGYYIVISHGSGNTTMYAHMTKGSFKVSAGDKVKQGQVIGKTGSTGYSTGPHLHYEIKEGGVNIDPLKYLPGYYLV